MVNFSRSDLLELFFEEVRSYIPEMRKGLRGVIATGDMQAVAELHRLFHNVKGAAAQVQLVHLSRGARVVEEYLGAILEDGVPVITAGLDSVDKSIELLADFGASEPLGDAEEEAFCQAVEAMVWPREGQDVFDAEGDPQGEVRSLLPLLSELAGCLSEDSCHREQNRPVYNKLSATFSTLAALTETRGLEGQSHLFRDFSSLLGAMADGGNPYQDEIAGMIQDFLGFVEVAFAENSGDRPASLHKIHQQLTQVKALLPFGDVSPAGEPSDRGALLADDIFEDHENSNDSIDFLDDMLEVDLPVAGGAVRDNGDAYAFLTEETLEEAEGDDSLGDDDSDLVVNRDIGESQAYTDNEQAALAEIFKEECEEHFISINVSLTHLEQQVALDSSDRLKIIEPIREIRRAVHTLKGAAAITGVTVLARGAHILEDMLDWLYDHNEAIGREEIQLIGESVGTLENLAVTADPVAAERLRENVEKYLGDEKRKEGGREEIAVESDSLGPLAEAEHVVVDPVGFPEDSGTLRVRLDDLDELLSVEGELVVARDAIEKMVEEITNTLGDLENVKDNLRRKSQELESGFEVQALYGGTSPVKGDVPPMLVDGQGGQDFAEFNPLELDRYSELNLIIRSLNEISVDVNSIYSTLRSLTRDIDGQVSKQQLTMRQMQDKLMRIRMTPLSSISRVLYGTVRSTAAKLGKTVDLNIVGEDVYMDRFVWAKVTDPLEHILRNSVDHGIESAEERLVAGKAERGMITLRAEQRSRYVILHISDDGGGLDPHLLREKLSALKIVDNPEELSDEEVFEYIFYPSVSTKKDVSELSGRGVGLDVVRKNIQDLRGSIHIDNSPGKGLRFEIHIPFTLSVNRAVVVSVSESLFAIPLQDIDEIRQFKAEDLIDEAGQLSLLVQGEPVPFASLASYVQLGEEAPPLGAGVVILFSATTKNDGAKRRFVLSVTEVVEQREIIVKNLGSHLTRVRGVAGVTVSGAGDLVPILNLRELVEVGPQLQQRPVTPTEIPAEISPFKVLIVDDSVSVRNSVAWLVESCGWVQRQAVDGLEALAQLESYMPDVIILDIEMPRMNGYEFKSNINNRDAFKEIPVVMLTSRASEKHQLKARELGIAYYLTKPYEEKSFIRILEKIEAERKVEIGSRREVF